MCTIKKTGNRRGAFTLIELLVVIAIILVIAALAAAFAPRVSDSTNLSRAVDQLEQWLLTAKMRAKRDGLATGVRLVQTQGDAAGMYSQLQYIQQPEPLSGSPGGGIIQSAGGGVVQFGNVDFTMGGTLPTYQMLVQPGDYLEVRGGGVYLIGSVTGPNSVQLASTTGYDASLVITTPTTNYRILRQPRLLIGESPLDLPNNFAVDLNLAPPPNITPRVIATTPPVSYYEILFSPSGAVIGTNAGSGKVLMIVHDVTLDTADITNMAGVIAVQCRTGFIGAYSMAPGPDPFLYAEQGRESGL